MIRLRRRIVQRRRLLRFAALGMLGATLISALEPVVGMVRDGDIHHESALMAAAHSRSGVVQHSRKVVRDQSSDDQERGHGYGTAADHCTHAHGAFVATAQSFEFQSFERRMDSFEPAAGRSATLSAPRHPPGR